MDRSEMSENRKTEDIADPATGEIITIDITGPSTLPDTIDYSKIPEGQEPQVFDQNTGMNMPDKVPDDRINIDDVSDVLKKDDGT